MTYLSKYSGIAIITILAAVPGIIWAFQAATPNSFSSLGSAALSVGKLLGLSGMALFSLNFILAARLKFTEPLFRGLNRAYIVHHFVGGLALIFLLFHPMLLTLQYLTISLSAAGSFLLSTLTELDKFLGELALATLVLLLVLTFYVKLPYQFWKLTHKFMGLAYFLASLHVLLIPSDVSVIPLLRGYMQTLIATAYLCILYRTVFRQFTVPRFQYKVANVVQVNPQVVEITMSPIKQKMHYRSGQFVFVEFRARGVRWEDHPFSIVSEPAEPNLRITVKSVGDFTETLKLLQAGAPVFVEGPFGQFTFQSIGNPKQLWIAGGIGITPFLGMVRELEKERVPPATSVILYYVVNKPNEAVFLEELRAIAQKFSFFKLV
ncbi:MAG: Oxidoreductase, FAD-binding protein, partial [Parcubacteria group bacterium GW2011_GWA2_51_12]